MGLYARPFPRDTRNMDPRNWVSGVKFPSVVARNSAQMLCRLCNFTEGAIYKIACLDE